MLSCTAITRVNTAGITAALQIREESLMVLSSHRKLYELFMICQDRMSSEEDKIKKNKFSAVMTEI